uniref:Histone deacetylase complex subunit SAP130 C-terminal domain-containing protein n=1 Tax=Musca domestica TaxID=7370 RepID=A0A1I8M6L0_MUSDO
MNSGDGSNGPGGGSGAGPGGGGGEPLKIIKTQLIPHPHPVSLQQSQQQQHHSPLPSPTTSTPTPLQLQSSSSTTITTPPNTNISNSTPPTAPQQSVVHHTPSIQLKNPTNVTNLFSLNPVAAKITHVKTTTIDAVGGGSGGGGGISLSGLTPTAIGSVGGGGGGGAGNSGGIVTSAGLSAVGAIKVGNSGAVATSLSGTPIALNSSQSPGAGGATSIRAIGAGGQSTQVRVVMSNLMSPSMIKQLENAGPGRTQITAFPTASARSVSNTSITVTRSATQATYLPRPNASGTQMTGVGMGVSAGQRLVTPIRTTPASVQGGTSGGATVTGITAAGNFVRGTAVSRNTSSPATTVISPATSTTWMAANQSGHQVQLIRAIPHQPRQRIITTQGISGVPVSATGSVASVSGTVVTTTASALQSGGGAMVVSQQHHTPTSQQQGQQSTIQTVSSASSQQQQQQQTYVATVLPPRQHQATLVYSSNVSGSQQLTAGQQQQFNPTSVAGGGPRFAVATPLTPGSGSSGATRQIRPIPFAKSFSATKLNTTSISIRAPNLPQLAPSMAASNVVSSANVAAANSPRSTTVTGVTASSANVIPSTTTRIIQLQQQPGGTTQQIIGPTGRLAANVMLQPIIVNTAGAGKIGIRPPVTMAAKVQPPLTITQLGIGKLPSSSSSATSVSGGGGGQQNINTSSGNASPSISSASITVTNLSTNATTQLVNVSQAGGGTSGGQLLATQNLVTSSSGSTVTAAGGATVVPLAINARGSSGGNIITGTMTPIKNASAITVGKVMTQLSSPLDNSANSSSNNVSATSSTANVFIHAPTPQRPHSNSSTSSNSGGVVVNTSLSSAGGASSSQAPASVLTSAGANVVAGTFLQPGSTIYYESVPASSVQVSTGVLSLTTTTVTSSTMSQNQIASSAANLSISSLPFVTHAGAGSNSTTATFTVVPSTGGRTIGQLQIPVSNAGTQIQTVPVRFSQLSSTGQMTGDTGISVSQAASQLLQQSAAGLETSQIIIPASQCQPHVSTAGGSSSQSQQTHQMVIPLQTSIKVTSGSTGTAVVSNFLRKRDADGSPIRAAKNLQPTLISMGSANNLINNSSSPASSSIGGGSSYSLTSVTSSSGGGGGATVLTAEALAKKDRSNNSLSTPMNSSSLPSARSSRADSPASSDGSTTVSANSSPGVEQQIQDNNMIINRMTGGSNHTIESHFNPINEQHILPGTPVTTRNLSSMVEHHHGGAASGGIHGPSSTATTAITIQQRLNGVGGTMDCPPRKKSRRSTNDSQLSTHSQASLSLPPPQAANNNNSTSSTSLSQPPAIAQEPTVTTVISNGTASNTTAGVTSTPSGNEVVNGKENTKPVEFILKRPKNCTLMSTYKQTWKSAYNHFQRYSDVKPREERRPTIMDLANQNNVLGKINGWKIYHLKSQMEDLCENESLGYEKLSSMLKQMESNGITNEIERISDLLKGNMQRSKIIVDGVSEAQNQIMKIFEHKSHVSDIITRCASKRNYKKREKV